MRVEEGAYADRLLDAGGSPSVRALVKGVLQEQGSLDVRLEKLLHTPLGELDPRVVAILRCGALQLLYNPDLPAPAYS